MNTIFRIVGFGTAIFLVFVANAPVAPALAHEWATPGREEPADAIVVLGSGIGADGRLDGVSLTRAIHGIKLYKRRLSPTLLFMGKLTRSGISEAQARRQLGRELGIPEVAMPAVRETSTTREEANETKAVLDRAGIHKILLVTDSLHMTRAKAVFEHLGFEVLPAPSDQSFLEGLPLLETVLAEYAAWLYYRAVGYI